MMIDKNKLKECERHLKLYCMDNNSKWAGAVNKTAQECMKHNKNWDVFQALYVLKNNPKTAMTMCFLSESAFFGIKRDILETCYAFALSEGIHI